MITLSSSAGGCEGSLGVPQLCFLGRGCEVEGGPSFQQKTDTHASWETSSAWNGLHCFIALTCQLHGGPVGVGSRAGLEA